ncbi:hypothetical protein OH77DRAFT_1248321 [Trametes cingulata]|nr:hypothetical protein OH77DRAFT_1248321 [Trametes cingulata]
MLHLPAYVLLRQWGSLLINSHSPSHAVLWQPSGQQDMSMNPAVPPFPVGWKLPSIKEVIEQRKELFTPEEKGDAFAELAGTVKTYTDEMIERWNSEIDTYLVYAGLFSAIVTAFNVQSYLGLQQQSDPTLAAIRQISLQLSSLTVQLPFVNSTHPAFECSDAVCAGSAPGPAPDTATIVVNTLWFSSLVLSLSSASVGIMVKQWLNQFKSGLPSEKSAWAKGESRKGDTLESMRLRQYRLNNLEKWRVHLVVLAVPILLQLALALFLAGLLVLVWTLNHTVAAVTTSVVLLLAIFTVGTPVHQSNQVDPIHCPRSGIHWFPLHLSIRCPPVPYWRGAHISTLCAGSN